MPNRLLTKDELERVRVLLRSIREQLETLSGGDKELLFAYRRKVYKDLTYDERSKPTARRKLKKLKREEQNGLCPICNRPLPETYCVLDRFNACDGYTAENTRLIDQDCDTAAQRAKRYA
jgi:hypothetical protein